MKRFIISSCIALTALYAFDAHAEIDNGQPAPATRAAISALYVAGDVAQKAITIDVCEGDTYVDTYAARDALRDAEALRQYGHIRDALHAAYDATPGSDETLQKVSDDFCAWAWER